MRSSRSTKQQPAPAVPGLPPTLVSCTPYYERVRVYLRRFLAYLKPWEARSQVSGASGQLLEAPGEGVSLDTHVIRVLVGHEYAASRNLALAGLDRQLAQASEPTDEGHGVGARFDELRRRLALAPAEVDLLWLLLLPELVPEFLWLYRAIWSDAAQIACQEDFLAHVLDPYGERSREVRSLLTAQGKLLRLLLVEEVEVRSSRGERYFRASRRLVEHLLGIEMIDGSLAAMCEPVPLTRALADCALDEPAAAVRLQTLLVEAVGRSDWSGAPGEPPVVFHLFGPPEVGKRTLAATLAAGAGRGLVRLDLAAWSGAGTSFDLALLLLRARREAFLRNSLLLLDDADPLAEERMVAVAPLLGQFLATQAEPVFLCATTRLGRLVESLRRLVPFELRTPGSERREQIWGDALAGLGVQAGADIVPRDLARKYNLPPGKILRALAEARSLARLRGDDEPVCHRDLVKATTAQLAHDLGSVADRVERTLDWDDLILPDECLRTLQEIVRRYRHLGQVMDEWGFRDKFVYGTGISVLFSGPPGTGKTMTAGIIARELDMELFRIDLSRVVSKWIGETEKNLARVFDEGKASHAIILFDEADSLFGRRGEVRSSVDRYSNLEVNYLLQRMESYEGISILTTNQSQSMDEAFMRRITFKIPFPFPDAKTRLRLWRSMLPPQAKIDPGVHFQLLAEKFEFSGGYIKNAVLRSAFLAAEARRPISQKLLLQAAIDEARGLGRLLRIEDILEDEDELEEFEADEAERGLSARSLREGAGDGEESTPAPKGAARRGAVKRGAGKKTTGTRDRN